MVGAAREDLALGTAGLAGGAMGASLGATGGARGLVDFRARPAGRYPRGGGGASVGGTGSGRSGAVNFAGFLSAPIHHLRRSLDIWRRPRRWQGTPI